MQIFDFFILNLLNCNFFEEHVKCEGKSLRELFNANSSFIDVVSRFILVISVDFDTSVV